MGITASNSIASVTTDINTSSVAVAQTSSGHDATANTNEKTPAPVQQKPNDIKG